MRLRPFSFEDARTGRRRFAAATLLEFWHHYSGLVPSQRHYYEILREGTPCRLCVLRGGWQLQLFPLLPPLR
jgi:hypothetical protein